MDLYLIRHTDALPLEESGSASDADRPLSPTGEAQARTLAAAFRRRGIRLDQLIASPLLRAQQTAEGIIAVWGADAPPLSFSKRLAPGLKPRRLSRYLNGMEGNALGLVGHQPDLNEYAAWLIGNKKVQLDLAKGGVAYLNVDAFQKGGATLRALLTPEWLAEVAGVSLKTG